VDRIDPPPRRRNRDAQIVTVGDLCGRPRNSPWDERRYDKALCRSRRRSNRKSATGLMSHVAPPRCCFLVAVRHAEAENRRRSPPCCQRGRRTQGEELRGHRQLTAIANILCRWGDTNTMHIPRRADRRNDSAGSARSGTSQFQCVVLTPRHYGKPLTWVHSRSTARSGDGICSLCCSRWPSPVSWLKSAPPRVVEWRLHISDGYERNSEN
jgi:hypothetical protein